MSSLKQNDQKVEEFLKEHFCAGDEILAHPDTADVQTARDWATEFVVNAGDTEMWNPSDFDALEDITDDIKSGKIIINLKKRASYS